MASVTAAAFKQARNNFLSKAPGLSERLPKRHPERIVEMDRQQTIRSLRDATGLLSTGLVLFGWGDGEAARLLSEDPTVQERRLDIIVLPHEMAAFAHHLTSDWLQGLFRREGVRLHFPAGLEDIPVLTRKGWGSHGEITWISGCRVIADHPLLAEAAQLRHDWLPTFHKGLAERLDNLGNDVYDTFMGAKHSLMHGRRLTDHPRNRHLYHHFKGQKAICIGAGPTASSWFEQIRAIQNEAIIICADSILGGLLDAGIEPDIVTMVERLPEMAKLVEEHGPRCSTTMWALPVVHKDAVAPFNDRLMWWWNLDDLYPWLMPQEPRLISSGRSTGTMGISVAAWLGCSEAYLVGHDLAYIGGKSHSSGTNDFTITMQELDDHKLSRTSGEYYTRLFDVPANGGGTVETCGMWELFRSDIEEVIKTTSGGTTFINMGYARKTGAIIAGTVPGDFPEPSGTAIDKTLPTAEQRDDEWDGLKARSLRLLDDMDAIRNDCQGLRERFGRMNPLSLDDATLKEFTASAIITNMVSAENKMWFQYVFRAAMRNLMVRLQQNAHVRTRRERNWNQARVIDLYAEAMIALIDRLRPELDEALEPMR